MWQHDNQAASTAFRAAADALYGFTGAQASNLQSVALADSCLALGAKVGLSEPLCPLLMAGSHVKERVPCCQAHTLACSAGWLSFCIASAAPCEHHGWAHQHSALSCLQSTHHARQKLEAVAASGALGPAAEGARVIYAQVSADTS